MGCSFCSHQVVALLHKTKLCWTPVLLQYAVKKDEWWASGHTHLPQGWGGGEINRNVWFPQHRSQHTSCSSQEATHTRTYTHQIGRTVINNWSIFSRSGWLKPNPPPGVYGSLAFTHQSLLKRRLVTARRQCVIQCVILPLLFAPYYELEIYQWLARPAAMTSHSFRALVCHIVLLKTSAAFAFVLFIL